LLDRIVLQANWINSFTLEKLPLPENSAHHTNTTATTGTSSFQTAQNIRLNSFITKRNSIMSLFGNTTSNQGGGLFGASQQQQPQQQQQQQQQHSGGLFGQSTANAPAPQNQSVFAQQQTGNPLAGTLSAGFGANHTGAMGAQSQRELAQSRLDAAGLNSVARTDKSPADAMAVLITKWDPNDQRTSLQKYLYNATTTLRLASRNASGRLPCRTSQKEMQIPRTCPCKCEDSRHWARDWSSRVRC
jgi:hypothetical protein